MLRVLIYQCIIGTIIDGSIWFEADCRAWFARTAENLINFTVVHHGAHANRRRQTIACNASPQDRLVYDRSRADGHRQVWVHGVQQAVALEVVHQLLAHQWQAG